MEYDVGWRKIKYISVNEILVLFVQQFTNAPFIQQTPLILCNPERGTIFERIYCGVLGCPLVATRFITYPGFYFFSLAPFPSTSLMRPTFRGYVK